MSANVSANASTAIVAVAVSRKRKPKTKIWFWSAECKYEVILDNVRELGWRLVDDERCESKANLYWIDVAAIHERFRTVQPWQTINHFPGMPNIARKNRMGQNLNRMLKLFPVRRTYLYPVYLEVPFNILTRSHIMHLRFGT
jgi:hypothetical protein